MPTETPVFEHDCEACVYLGHFNNHDLYWCGQNSSSATVIARCSSEPSDYLLGLSFAGINPLLREAKNRAIQKGLEVI